MNAGNIPLNMPVSEVADDLGMISPALTLMCVSCGHDHWMHHVFNEKGHRPQQIRRCVECKGRKGRWMTEYQKGKVLDARYEAEGLE